MYGQASVKAGLFKAYTFAAAVLLAALISPHLSPGAVVRGEVRWSGEVRVEEDIRVLHGAHLIVEPGARIVFAEALSTKTEPAFWSPETELVIEGKLTVEGERDRGVFFSGDGAWGGLVLAPGSEASLRWTDISGAEQGITHLGSSAKLENITIKGGKVGLVLGSESRLVAAGVMIDAPEVGVEDLRPKGVLPSGIEVVNAEDARYLGLDWRWLVASPEVELRRPGEGAKEFLGDYTVSEDERWSGDVIISGRVTVLPEVVLTLDPGAMVSFRKVDTNEDGLGEGELLILGGIRSLGTEEAPVIFTSAEPAPAPGDWDKVSLISSEDTGNVFRHTRFLYGVQALHGHFSRFSVESGYFSRNLRAVQFQESERVEILGSLFVDNKQALRFRDSNVEVRGNRFVANPFGVHAFRARFVFEGNRINGSLLGGFLAKESEVTFKGNDLSNNRVGAMFKDPGSELTIEGNRFASSVATTLSLNNVKASVRGNSFEGGGLHLVAVDEGSVSMSRNMFGPSIGDAVHLKGLSDLKAKMNYWSTADPSERIFDGKDKDGLGIVTWAPVLDSPPDLTLP